MDLPKYSPHLRSFSGCFATDSSVELNRDRGTVKVSWLSTLLGIHLWALILSLTGKT